MLEHDRQVLDIGLGRSGRAACELFCRSGARGTGVDRANTRFWQHGANWLRARGSEVALGIATPPEHEYSWRAEHADLSGEASRKMQAACNVFTPCTVASTLLEGLAEAASNTTSGDVVLLSPACSSWDQFRNHQHRSEVFCQAVKSIGSGVREDAHNMSGSTATI